MAMITLLTSRQYILCYCCDCCYNWVWYQWVWLSWPYKLNFPSYTPFLLVICTVVSSCGHQRVIRPNSSFNAFWSASSDLGFAQFILFFIIVWLSISYLPTSHISPSLCVSFVSSRGTSESLWYMNVDCKLGPSLSYYSFQLPLIVSYSFWTCS